jgi:8-oxo-dGTP pyrophosphatase MutT (NUDIX family)
MGVLKAERRSRELGAAAIQYAALPYRRGEQLEVLLVTSRETGRWVIPKGWPMKAKLPYATAEREALEEAGVTGRIARQSIGDYPYAKRLAGGASLDCLVQVYPLEVLRQRAEWPEKAERTSRWFSLEEAAAAVQEPELAALIMAFAPPPAA